VLQCVAAQCSVLQIKGSFAEESKNKGHVAVRCSALQSVAVCCCSLQCVAACCSLRSVLQKKTGGGVCKVCCSAF